MSFPLGRPILVMLVAAALSGMIIMARPTPKQAKMVAWIFAESHGKSYRGDDSVKGESPQQKYERTTGNTLDIVNINVRAEDVKLLSIFNTHGQGQLVPDVVEVEISKIGKFFRPPISEIGFLPLNDLLKRSGWYDPIVQTRFAPWSKKGVIYGIPHDLHPVAITYRKDLFDQAGVDLAAAKTWLEFREAGLKFRRYWTAQARPRWAAGLARTSSDNLVILLQQRGINLVDDENGIFLNDPRVANTVRAYADMVAGPEPVGTDFDPSPGMAYRDVANGEVCAMITPDWMVGYLKIYASDCTGKLAIMPLPVFDPTDKPTASWGGTMMGIPRDCRDPEAAWKLIEALYMDHDAIAYARQIDQIIPPIRSFWKDDIYQHGDPFFANNQNVNQMFIQLADQMPVRYVTPCTLMAQQLLSDVLNKTVNRIDAQQTKHLDEDIQQWLNDATATLDRWIKFETFED